jgi:hypothetical protein
MTFYTDNISDIDISQKEEIYKKVFNKFLNFIQIFENNKSKEKIDFWDLFKVLLSETNILNNVLFILDQYKRENDKNDNLAKLLSIFLIVLLKK